MGKKAQDRLKLLQDTKEAWVGYAENNETIASEFEVAEEEIKKGKKMYNLEAALADMKKRQDLYNKSNNTISGLFKSINDNFTCMSITLPEDKKKVVAKEISAVDAKLEVVGRFKDTVKVIEDFCAALVNFDNSLKAVDGWKDTATAEQKDIAAKLEILKKCAETEAALLPQGGNVDKDAQAFKNELNRITDYVTKLAADTKIECDKYSNDVKFWAEYRTGIKEYSPWLAGAEKAAADGAAQKMTTHAEADAEVAALRERYAKVKAVS